MPKATQQDSAILSRPSCGWELKKGRPPLRSPPAARPPGHSAHSEQPLPTHHRAGLHTRVLVLLSSSRLPGCLYRCKPASVLILGTPGLELGESIQTSPRAPALRLGDGPWSPTAPWSSSGCRESCSAALIMSLGLLSGGGRVWTRGRGAGVPGSPVGPLGQSHSPRMPLAALDAADCLSVSLRALPGRIPCWPPAGGAPTP